jgi:hypothetical protein
LVMPPTLLLPPEPGAARRQGRIDAPHAFGVQCRRLDEPNQTMNCSCIQTPIDAVRRVGKRVEA